jgi:GNAT superfamily N-acetyltransferase
VPNAEVRLELTPLQSSDRVTGLKCGDGKFVALKTFLEKHAREYEKQSLGRTYVMRQEGEDRILGYITLVCGEVVTDGKALIAGVEYNYGTYPAVKIARLFVDNRVRNAGLNIGTKLVDHALGATKDKICPTAGCRFVMVDAKKDSIGFYVKKGFTMLDTPENRNREEPVMFVDLYKADAA